jgi:hypothetical protein
VIARKLPAFLLAFFVWPYDRALAIIMVPCYLLILSVVCSAVKGVFMVALYRYATLREAPTGFSADLIDGALGGRQLNIEGAGLRPGPFVVLPRKSFSPNHFSVHEVDQGRPPG